MFVHLKAKLVCREGMFVRREEKLLRDEVMLLHDVKTSVRRKPNLE